MKDPLDLGDGVTVREEAGCLVFESDSVCMKERNDVLVLAFPGVELLIAYGKDVMRGRT